MSNLQLDKMFGANSQINPLIKDRPSEQVVPSDILDDAPITPRRPTEGLSEQDTIQDIDYARRTLQFSVERSQQLVDLALANAADGSSPRDIEAASTALNTCATLSEKLIDMHYKCAAPNQKNDMGTGNTFVNNSRTIVLTSSELLKQLSEENEEDVIDVK